MHFSSVCSGNGLLVGSMYPPIQYGWPVFGVALGFKNNAEKIIIDGDKENDGESFAII